MYPKYVQWVDHIQASAYLFSLLVRHIPKCLFFSISIANITYCQDFANKMVSLLLPCHSLCSQSLQIYIMWLPITSLSSRKINFLSERRTNPHRWHCSYFADPSYPSLSLSLSHYSPATLTFFIGFWHRESITTFKTGTNGFTNLEIMEPRLATPFWTDVIFNMLPS